MGTGSTLEKGFLQELLGAEIQGSCRYQLDDATYGPRPPQATHPLQKIPFSAGGYGVCYPLETGTVLFPSMGSTGVTILASGQGHRKVNPAQASCSEAGEAMQATGQHPPMPQESFACSRDKNQLLDQ